MQNRTVLGKQPRVVRWGPLFKFYNLGMIVWVKFLPPCDVTGEQLLHYAPFLFTSKKGGKKTNCTTWSYLDCDYYYYTFINVITDLHCKQSNLNVNRWRNQRGGDNDRLTSHWLTWSAWKWCRATGIDWKMKTMRFMKPPPSSSPFWALGSPVGHVGRCHDNDMPQAYILL